MKRIWIFLGITFAVTWAMAFGLMAMGGLQNPLATLVFMGFMLVPALSSLATRAITGQGFRDMWLKPNFKRGWLAYLLAWFLPPALIAAGAALYFVLFPASFDPAMSAILELGKQQIAATGQTMPEEALRVVLLGQLAIGVFLSPLLNIVTTTGEELGWRGYLLPGLLERFSPRVAALITGAIWGLWHAPMIAMGHNYGLNYPGAPWWGIGAMIVFCVVLGSFFAWVTLKAGSMLPASVAHGELNGMAAAGSYFLVAGEGNPFVGPLPTGIIGGMGFVVAGVICYLLLNRAAPRPQAAEAVAEALPVEATGTES